MILSYVSWVTGHFCHKALRHQDTLGHFGTGLKTLWHQKRGTRHFDTSAVIEEKPGHFDPGQFRWDIAPPVIRLKLRHQFCGAEVSRCRNVLWPSRRSVRLPSNDLEHLITVRRRLQSADLTASFWYTSDCQTTTGTINISQLSAGYCHFGFVSVCPRYK